MIDIFAKLMGEFFNAARRETSRIIKSEVEYVTTTIKGSIKDGIRDGFDAIRANIFYLFLAMGCTTLGMVFAIWGLAKLFETYLGYLGEGTGFLVFGLLTLLIGMFSFSMSKPSR